MIDLVLLIFFTYYIGRQAQNRGLNVLRWRVRLVVAWIVGEIIVGGASYYLTRSYTTASLSGMMGAALAALIVFQTFFKIAAAKKQNDLDNDFPDNDEQS